MLHAVLAFAAVCLAALLVFRQFILLPIQPLTAPLTPLTDDQRDMALRLEGHVRAIASHPHNIANFDRLEQAARYIASTLKSFGLRADAHVFTVDGSDVRNIEVVFEGAEAPPMGRGATLVIGAHYDSAGASPGANDNGSGVAALIELARSLALIPAAATRRLRLVFFVNEEHPYGKTEDMGALRHARGLIASGEPVMGMIALETLGYFSERPGSQRLPAPFKWIYPDRGNFAAFVGLPGARAFLARALASFRQTGVFPSTGTIAPAFIEGADLSDHWAYHRVGIPAMMITDTAPYRNPFYHALNDTPDTVDYASLARITGGLEQMLRALLRT